MAIAEIERYALEHNVPIMSQESIAFISATLIKTNSRSLLEIGTAIAYSGISIASEVEGLMIDTLERDVERYEIAKMNIEKYGFSKRINCLEADALEFKNRQCYDAVLIDAAKAQNGPLFRLYSAFANKVVIIDNIDFHGFTGHSATIKSRNLRQMVGRIERFLEYLETRSDLEVSYHHIGDGMLVITRR